MNTFIVRYLRSRRAQKSKWVAGFVAAPPAPFAALVRAQAIRRKETRRKLAELPEPPITVIAPSPVLFVHPPKRVFEIERRRKLVRNPPHWVFPPPTGPPSVPFTAYARRTIGRSSRRQGIMPLGGATLVVRVQPQWPSFARPLSLKRRATERTLQRPRPNPFAIGSVGSLAAAGSLSISGAADLDALGSLIAAGSLSIGGAADLDALGSLVAAGALSISGAADLDAQAALAAAGTVSISGAADLDALGSLAVAGALSINGAAGLTSQSGITATGTLSITGSANLDARGALAAAGSVSISGTAANLTDADPVDIAAAGSLAINGAASLSAAGVLAAAGALSVTGSADLGSSDELIASGSLIISGSASLNATGALSADGQIQIFGAALLTDANAAVGYLTGTVVVRPALTAQVRLLPL